MTLEEATELAMRVYREKRLRLVAVGQFVSLEEIALLPERFGVSVLVVGASRPTVIWSEAEYVALLPPIKPKRSGGKAIAKVEETQLSLF